jgi:hypothetical protein
VAAPVEVAEVAEAPVVAPEAPVVVAEAPAVAAEVPAVVAEVPAVVAAPAAAEAAPAAVRDREVVAAPGTATVTLTDATKITPTATATDPRR